MEELDLEVRGFGDAVAVLMRLHDDFGYAHAVALLSEWGHVLELVALADATYTIDTAMGWALCRVLDLPGVRRVVFFSAGDGGASTVRERDVRKAEVLRSTLAESGFEVLDWLFSDGELMRSMAYTAGWDTWDELTSRDADSP